MLKTPLAPLRLCVIIFLLLSLASPAFSQRKGTARFDPDGSFWIHGQPPNEFLDFGGINLNAKRVRRLPSPGVQLNNGTTFRFKTLTVKRDNFTFTTMTIGGVSYSFAGKFLKGGVYSSGILDDETPVLEGTLTKFRGGKKVASRRATKVRGIRNLAPAAGAPAASERTANPGPPEPAYRARHAARSPATTRAASAKRSNLRALTAADRSSPMMAAR